MAHACPPLSEVPEEFRNETNPHNQFTALMHERGITPGLFAKSNGSLPSEEFFQWYQEWKRTLGQAGTQLEHVDLPLSERITVCAYLLSIKADIIKR